MILFCTSNRIYYYFFYIVVIYERFPVFQSSEGIRPCSTIKEHRKGILTNWYYKPICKENRTDLYSNVQAGRTVRFCVNVTTGIPFYRTAKPKSEELNCNIAKFQLNITTMIQSQNMSQIIELSLDQIFRSSIGNQIIKTVAQKNISDNRMIVDLIVYSIGHRSVNDILSIIGSRIKESKLNSTDIDPAISKIELITENLEDPPPVLYNPNEMSMDSGEFSSGNNKKRNVLGAEKTKRVGSNNLDGSFIAVISVVGIVGSVLTVLLILYCIYRLRKKDEGSYALNKNMIVTNDKTHKSMIMVSNTKEYFA